MHKPLNFVSAFSQSARGIVCLAFMFLHVRGIAQPPDSLLLESYIQQAQQLTNQMKFDSAVYYYEQAEIVSFRLENYSQYIRSMQIRAILLYQHGDLSVLDTLIAHIEIEANKYLPAESSLFLSLYNDLVVMAAYRKQRHKRDYYLRKAENWMEEYGTSERAKSQYAQLTSNVGAMIMEEGDGHRGIQYLQQCLRQLQDLPQDKNEIIDLTVIAYQHLSSAYQIIGEQDSSFKFAKKSLDLFNASPLTNPFLHSRAYLILGFAHIEVNNHDQAIETGKKILQLLPGLPTEGARANREWEAKLILSHAFYEKGELDQAHKMLQETIGLQQAFFTTFIQSPNHLEIGRSIYLLGEIYRLKGIYDSALVHFQHAIPYFCIRFSSSNIQDNPSVDDIKIDNKTHINLFRKKAELQLILAKQSGKKEDFLACMHTYQLVAEIIQRDLYRIRADQSRLFMMEDGYPAFEGAIETAWHLYQMTDSTAYVDIAFQLMEQSKAVLLTAELLTGDASILSTIPDSLRAEEQILLKERQFYHEQVSQLSMADPIDDSLLSLNKNREWEKEQQLALLQLHFQEHYPRYSQVISQSAGNTLKEVQAQLSDRNAGFLEYFWGQQALYAIAITENQASFHLLDSISPHQDLLKQTLDYLHQDADIITSSSFQDGLYSLKEWLWKPVLPIFSSVDRLIIASDGLIGYLPFELLPDHQDNQTSDYLLHRFPISYVNSARLLFRDSFQPEPSLPFVGFGASYDKDLLLLYTEQEVLNLQAMMGGEAYVGSQATEKRFRQSGLSAQILHFAMHGFPNADQPSQSSLLFQTDPDIKEDGHLYAYELYHLSLAAELAVLSACHTGYGPFAKGEGIRSLAQAFQYAGCPSVLMSLWEANGLVAKDLMPLFYGHLKQGLPKDEALQQAKLDFLAHAPEYLHDPRMWANFVLIGDAEPLEEHGLWWGWWVMIVAGIGVVLLLIGKRRWRTPAS
ncbi:MAG: CHAT domain-containing tetratricopeptide repeat protein [Bacteroidota bacterium]